MVTGGIRINAAVQVTEEAAGLRVRLFELDNQGEAGPAVADVVCGPDAVALLSIVRQLAELGVKRAEHFRRACDVGKKERHATEESAARARRKAGLLGGFAP